MAIPCRLFGQAEHFLTYEPADEDIIQGHSTQRLFKTSVPHSL